MDTAKPVGLEDLLELVFNDCLMDFGGVLSSSELPEVLGVLEVP